MWGAVATAGAGALSAGAGMYSASKSASTSKKIAAMQIAWERERATNAHQWEVQDLMKAGINPTYTATGGSGASTSSISPPTPDYSGINTGMANAAQMIGLSIQDKDVKAKTALSAAQTAKTLEETKNITPKTNAEIKALSAQAVKTAKETTSESGKLTNFIGSIKERAEKAGKGKGTNGKDIPWYGEWRRTR